MNTNGKILMKSVKNLAAHIWQLWLQHIVTESNSDLQKKMHQRNLVTPRYTLY